MPECVAVGSFIAVVQKMVSSRLIPRKQSSGDPPALKLGGDNNIKKRKRNDLSLLVDNVSLLLFFYFCYRYFSFHCLFFFFRLALAQGISLHNFL